MYIINTISHGKCFVRYLRTRIRNLTRSLRSLVRFLIRQQLVRKYRTPALSMKYSLYIIHCNDMRYLTLQSAVLGRKKEYVPSGKVSGNTPRLRRFLPYDFSEARKHSKVNKVILLSVFVFDNNFK